MVKFVPPYDIHPCSVTIKIAHKNLTADLSPTGSGQNLPGRGYVRMKTGREKRDKRGAERREERMIIARGMGKRKMLI